MKYLKELGILFLLISFHSICVASLPIPPGYSTDSVHVKFKEGAEVDQPAMLLPAILLSDVESITRLFTLSEKQLDELRQKGEERSGESAPELNMWFQINLKPGTAAEDFIEILKGLDIVEDVQPIPLPAPLPAITPDFTWQQGYLGPATDGIDAVYSVTLPGGNASGVKIYDVEYNWNQTHEDLSKANGLPLTLEPGDTIPDWANTLSYKNHGSAVLGVLIADNDSKGVTGISWGADIGLAPAITTNLGYNPANSIILAVADGKPGDVILLELQTPVCGLSAYGPSEWISSVFDAIKTAAMNGFVVVEAAGNGGVDLDQPACGTTFDRTVRDSGAIIVGMGGPPGSAYFPDRERISSSTYGSRVDVQGWGKDVMTTGYGHDYVNPDDPTNPDYFYYFSFGGTSAASPIVAGAVANLQGIAFNQFGRPLRPLQLRRLLVSTGSPQLGDTAEHIGPRPDLRAAIENLKLGIEGIDIEKLTNGSQADGANDPDVQRIAPGEMVTWSYIVTNTGEIDLSFEEVVVTDNQVGITPLLDVATDDGGDLILSMDEMWTYEAMAQAMDLEIPSDGITVVPGCNDNRNTYQNIGRVEIIGATVFDEDISHYCNSGGDTDNDGIPDGEDNCPTTANTDQADSDADGTGDACDADDDNDGIGDEVDNCPVTSNPNQADFDGDGVGNACDSDRDGDGVGNNDDLCPFSPATQPVNADGCTGTQFVAYQCPQDAFVQHGKYVSCIAHAANDAVTHGLISKKQMAVLVRDAAIAKN